MIYINYSTFISTLNIIYFRRYHCPWSVRRVRFSRCHHYNYSHSDKEVNENDQIEKHTVRHWNSIRVEFHLPTQFTLNIKTKHKFNTNSYLILTQTMF